MDTLTEQEALERCVEILEGVNDPADPEYDVCHCIRETIGLMAPSHGPIP